MTASVNKPRPAAIRVVIPFVFRHWLDQPLTAATVAGGLLGATCRRPVHGRCFSGHLVDAVTLGASDPAARRAAFTAFGAIVALGLVSMTLRLVGLHVIVPFTAADHVRRVARRPSCACSAFSTDWHANSFCRLYRAQDQPRHVGARSAQRHHSVGAVCRRWRCCWDR